MHPEYALLCAARLQGQMASKSQHTSVNHTTNVDTLFLHQGIDQNPIFYDINESRKKKSLIDKIIFFIFFLLLAMHVQVQGTEDYMCRSIL